MKISAFNGSPRGHKSNSLIILKWVLEKVNSEYSISNLNLLKKHEDYITELQSSEALLFVFPLYTDAMPGIVMKFFEILSNNKKILQGKRVLYIIHSGFPEGFHSLPLKKFLENLSSKLNFIHHDVIIMGGSEGTRLMPPKMLKKKQASFNKIGELFEYNKPIDEAIKQFLYKPAKLSQLQKTGFKILKTVGLANIYWDKSLKKNGVYGERFAKPYSE